MNRRHTPYITTHQSLKGDLVYYVWYGAATLEFDTVLGPRTPRGFHSPFPGEKEVMLDYLRAKGFTIYD